MSGRDNTQSLLALRKLTRAITEAVRAEMVGHLSTLTPLFVPTTVLGDYVQGGQKEPTRKTEKAFKQLQSLYESVATTKPFNLPRELSVPLSMGTQALEITPHDYTHVAQTGAGTRALTVRAPLTWTLSYSGYPPSRFQELLNTKMRSNEEVFKFVLAYLVLHVVITNQGGLTHLLEVLRYPVSTAKLPEFGDLPITRIGPPVNTTRPSDAVIVESAELTGMDAFEEVVKVEDLPKLKDAFRDRLLEIAQQHLPESIAR
jgi:hypothetical protein